MKHVKLINLVIW